MQKLVIMVEKFPNDLDQQLSKAKPERSLGFLMSYFKMSVRQTRKLPKTSASNASVYKSLLTLGLTNTLSGAFVLLNLCEFDFSYVYFIIAIICNNPFYLISNNKFMSLPALKRVNSRPRMTYSKKQAPVILTHRSLSKEDYNLQAKNEEIAEEHRNIRLISNYINSKILPKNQLRSDSPFRKRIQTELNKDPVKGHFLAPTKILTTTCDKWVIYERMLEKYERGFKTDQPHKMEGLSKLLVFYCTYVIVTKYELDIKKFQCIGTAATEEIIHSGTSIKADDMISLQSLLNIMILEESLQSQYCLAVNLGLFLHKKQSKHHVTMFDINKKNQHKFIELFVKFMNSSTPILKLLKTTIKDIGIHSSQSLNKSCANDIAKLSIQCLKIDWIADILKRDSYESIVRYIDDDGEMKVRNISVKGWQSNDFLQYRYICRSSGKDFGQSSCAIIYETDKVSAVIVLLGCYSMELRQKDIQISIEYFLKKKGLLDLYPIKPKLSEDIKESPQQKI